MSTLKLRRVDPAAHAGTRSVQRWRGAGHGAGADCLQRLPGYLRFCARSDGGNWHGLIMARDWLQHSLPQLQSLLAVEPPVTRIAGLFRAVPRALLLEPDELHYQALSDVELVDPQQLPTHPLPWLETSRGRVWVTQLPPLRTVNEPLDPSAWLSDLPLRLELILGVSHLSHARRIRLKEGDVLRITQRTQHGWLAGRCIGVFTFTEEGLLMQSTVADANQQAATDPGADVELGALCVRLEFILATHDINLATLSQIVDGQLIPLADNAARHIEVRANGKPVARGELVQLDEQLGVELIEVYRSTLSEHPR
ncbi:FliM/FliN family flagellar motor switch protein [Pseudomonas sp. PGPR40]|uniref:FliM/FliN family flagellar motor switch protein n=1 Tax=Pseudomonas sp. PGPR40 TaxID=2913476 RepID=UPI001EDB5361|nr:FliM/FliN family flagellar motor switch protein [Pseudomonas sp. PGPR40]